MAAFKMPEICGWYDCNRKCTRFWGELADHWACEGHYIIMTSNYESWCIPKDENGEYILENAMRWGEHRKTGINWLRANPNPEPKENK